MQLPVEQHDLLRKFYHRVYWFSDPILQALLIERVLLNPAQFNDVLNMGLDVIPPQPTISAALRELHRLGTPQSAMGAAGGDAEDEHANLEGKIARLREYERKLYGYRPAVVDASGQPADLTDLVLRDAVTALKAGLFRLGNPFEHDLQFLYVQLVSMNSYELTSMIAPVFSAIFTNSDVSRYRPAFDVFIAKQKAFGIRLLKLSQVEDYAAVTRRIQSLPREDLPAAFTIVMMGEQCYYVDDENRDLLEFPVVESISKAFQGLSDNTNMHTSFDEHPGLLALDDGQVDERFNLAKNQYQQICKKEGEFSRIMERYYKKIVKLANKIQIAENPAAKLAEYEGQFVVILNAFMGEYYTYRQAMNQVLGPMYANQGIDDAGDPRRVMYPGDYLSDVSRQPFTEQEYYLSSSISPHMSPNDQVLLAQLWMSHAIIDLVQATTPEQQCQSFRKVFNADSDRELQTCYEANDVDKLREHLNQSRQKVITYLTQKDEERTQTTLSIRESQLVKCGQFYLSCGYTMHEFEGLFYNDPVAVFAAFATVTGALQQAKHCAMQTDEDGLMTRDFQILVMQALRPWLNYYLSEKMARNAVLTAKVAALDIQQKEDNFYRYLKLGQDWDKAVVELQVRKQGVQRYRRGMYALGVVALLFLAVGIGLFASFSTAVWPMAFGAIALFLTVMTIMAIRQLKSKTIPKKQESVLEMVDLSEKRRGALNEVKKQYEVFVDLAPIFQELTPGLAIYHGDKPEVEEQLIIAEKSSFKSGVRSAKGVPLSVAKDPLWAKPGTPPEAAVSSASPSSPDSSDDSDSEDDESGPYIPTKHKF